MLTYTIAKPYLIDQKMTAYEFMPMEGDPTQEEIRQEQQERLEQETEAAKKRRDEILGKHKRKLNGGV